MMISHVSWTSLSGLTGQVMNETSRRGPSLSRPPATAAPMSTMRLEQEAADGADDHVLRRVGEDGLGVVQRRHCRRGVVGAEGALDDVDVVHRVDEPGGVGHIALVGSRSSPSRGSMTLMPSPKLVKPTRFASSTTSRSGVRPCSVSREGADLVASSTTCGGIRTMPVPLSTSQPPSASTSRASPSSTKTPVRSSTSSVARWMSWTSSAVKTLRLKPPLRSRPACGLRFTRHLRARFVIEWKGRPPRHGVAARSPAAAGGQGPPGRGLRTWLSLP